jgi:hypothetical protein
MMQAGTGPTRPAPERFPLGPIIFVALLATLALGGGIALVGSEGWPVADVAFLIAGIPVGAVPMYRVMTGVTLDRDTKRSDEDVRATRRLILRFAIGINVIAIAVVLLQLYSAGLGFAGGIMLGLFWWMVRQRWAAVGE